jgi:AcrR family transcriptional regulator
MRKQRKDAMETRQRLLVAAGEVFAAKGFWEATHAEICAKAGTNTAAVNYHFGSKENLYVEAWKHAFERSIEQHPPDGGIRPRAAVRERLRGRILAFMQRIADPDNHEVEIIHKEMANPTGLLAEAMQQVLDPMRQDMQGIVRELLGKEAGGHAVAFCEMSLMGQCFGPMLHVRRAAMSPSAAHPPGPHPQFDVEELADHVTQFTLAGIRGIRASTRKVTGNGRKRRHHTRGSRQE